MKDVFELPNPNCRWTVRRKICLISAISDGRLSKQEAFKRYTLSQEELQLWEEALDRHGMQGLRVTMIQVYKDRSSVA